MSQVRAQVSKKSEYYIPKNEYYTLVYLCLSFPEMLERCKEVSYGAYGGSVVNIRYYKDGIDSVGQTAMNREKYQEKINMILDTLDETCLGKDEAKYIFRNVCRGESYRKLTELEGCLIPRKKFYALRRKFFLRLYEKIFDAR